MRISEAQFSMKLAHLNWRTTGGRRFATPSQRLIQIGNIENPEPGHMLARPQVRPLSEKHLSIRPSL